MATPITFRNVQDFVQTPEEKRPQRFQMPIPSALPGLPISDRLKIAEAEGRTPVLTPDELIQMEYDRLAREVTPQATGGLPSRGPVDQPKAQEYTGPQYDPRSDAPVFEALAPEPPRMERPPGLHTPDELAAAEGTPYNPPTISRPIESHGEAPMPPDTGQDGGALQKLLKGIFTAGNIAEGAARGAAAGEGAQSFLGGMGRASLASDAERQREEAHRARVTGEAARTANIEQRTAMLPQQLAWEQEAQQINNEYKQTLAKYQRIVTQRIKQEIALAPKELSITSLQAAGQTAERLARAAQIRRLIDIGKAQTPEEAQRLMEQAELYRAQQEYYRSGIGLHEAQAGLAGARAADVREGGDEKGPFGSRSADLVYSSIIRMGNDLRNRHKKNGWIPDPTDKTGERKVMGEVVDEQALQNDPDFQEWQRLRQEYKKLIGQEPEGSTPGGMPDQPPQSFVDLVNQRFPRPQ